MLLNWCQPAYQKGFSQFPVVDEEGFRGLVTENEIIRWMGRQVRSFSTAINLENAAVKSVLKEKDPDLRGIAIFHFAKLDSPTDEVMSRFSTEPALEVNFELVLGDGMFELGVLHHPMILQRVILKFFHRSNPPEFRILVADADSDLYLSLFHQIEGLDSSKLGKCKDEFLNQAISPLDQEETDAYLQGFVQRVFPNGRFTHEKGADTSEPVIYREPVFYLRPRRHGYTNFISEILETIPNQQEFPDSLSRIVNCTESKPASAYRIDDSSRGANEDPDILLTKHANQEQLLIAKKLEKSGSVLVQGPPGTGKTHTIANLVGHLLAQGKRILITSHTNKALRVLREKVVTPLQPLCVSVLDNDSSSNRELRTAVEHIQKRLSLDDADELERQATKVLAERAILIRRLEEIRAKILQARWNESADICFAGMSTRPIEGAKYVRDGVETHDWIPAPVLLGSPLPLPDTDIKALYRAAAAVPPADIDQASLHLPRLNETMEPDEFAKLLELRVEALARDTSSGERFWKPVDDVSPDAVRRLETLAAELQAIVTDVADLPAWKLAAIQAGRDGGAAKEHLQKFVSSLSEEWERLFRCRTELLEHRVEFARIEPDEKALTIIESVIQHLEAGNKITFFTRITKREWVSVIDGVSVNSSSPTEVLHFRAAKAFALASVVRRKLARMWDNVMQPHGVPSASELGHTLENQCKAFIAPLTECLSWFDEKWSPRLEALRRSGFHWDEYLNSIPPEYSEHSEIKRLINAVTGRLVSYIEARKNLILSIQLENKLKETAAQLRSESGAREADVVRALRAAVQNSDPVNYQFAYAELQRLHQQRKHQEFISAKVSEMRKGAPGWADALDHRNPAHCKGDLPGDLDDAWKWRQLHDELEKRSRVSLEELMREAEQLRESIHQLTSDAVEAKAWAAQIRRTDPTQRQALGGYVKLRERLTKSGTGKRDAIILQAARDEMVRARTAVPVWIMPLSSVYATFKPSEPFDVLIIDEASQSDIQALAALYLGKQAIVVGDDKQVTPSAVGQELEAVQHLIDTMLLNIPARNLYDRKTSIYDLCNMSFEGLVQLTEHFRCVPEIIGFSNLIAYDNPIRPLRETSRVKMVPPFVLHRVNGMSSDKHNATEAEEIASLIMAASEHPDYQTNDRGETVSIGVISLLGESQALEIDKLLRKRMSPDDYQRRRILCGNPAHFQGDERDLVFLSMVDSATGNELLNLRGDGADGMYKKRFNVAVSRARDQVWVVHSLNPETNLQPNDIRRRLLDYARDPEAHKRAFETLAPRTESPFEKAVLKHLTNHGYRVHPQFAVGSYRIDFVIEYQNGRIAIECDGERFHTLENLQADMERQSVLERLGWRFIRIRGSSFYRDEAKTMQRVFAQLETHGILPSVPNEFPQHHVTERNDRVEQLRRRAAEIRASWAKSNETTTSQLNRSASEQASQPVRQTPGISQVQPRPESARTHRPVASGQDLIRQLKGQNGLITRAKLQQVLEGLIPPSDRIQKNELLAIAARELEFSTVGEKRRLEAALEEVEKSAKFKSTMDTIWRSP